MTNTIINTSVDGEPVKYYIIGNIINLVNHYHTQKIELRAYSVEDDRMIGMCDFAISSRNQGSLCYISVDPEFRQAHIADNLIKITHSYLAKKNVDSISGIFCPEPMASWAAEAFYRKNNYAIMFDAEYIFRTIKKEDKIPQEMVKWNSTTIQTKAKLQPLEEITVSPDFEYEREHSLALIKTKTPK